MGFDAHDGIFNRAHDLALGTLTQRSCFPKTLRGKAAVMLLIT